MQNRVVTPARAGRLEQNLSARLIYLEIGKIGDDLSHAGSFKCLPFRWQCVKVPRSRNMVHQNVFFLMQLKPCAHRGLTARKKWLTDLKDTKDYINQANEAKV